MTEDLDGASAPVAVSGTATPLLIDPDAPHDAILAMNQTEGTVVWFDDVDTVASGSLWSARFGERVELPFTGQAWGRAYATTEAGEALGGATVSVRPVVVSSSLLRGLLTYFSRLVTILRGVPLPKSACGTASYAFDICAFKGTSLNVANEGEVEVLTNALDLTGRTIAARNSEGETLDFVHATAVDAGEWDQRVRIEIASMPDSRAYQVHIVAIEGSDVREIMRGRVRGN
ncbi:MAG: hypothetical protein ACO1SV_27695 [Fimbriimonas sp.]